MDTFDPSTELYTVANTLSAPPAAVADDEPDPLDQGMNGVIPEASFFESTQHGAASGQRPTPRRHKSALARLDALPFATGCPTFGRDRCTIVLTHGDRRCARAELRRSARAERAPRAAVHRRERYE
jgi:hypothetical protein